MLKLESGHKESEHCTYIHETVYYFQECCTELSVFSCLMGRENCCCSNAQTPRSPILVYVYDVCAKTEYQTDVKFLPCSGALKNPD